ncbi:MAG: hypothetical protein ACYDA4_14520 [Ignavibacteriaceae bacterium]
MNRIDPVRQSGYVDQWLFPMMMDAAKNYDYVLFDEFKGSSIEPM